MRCMISLLNALEVHELLFSSFQSVATNDPFVVNKDGILLFLCAQIPAVSINFLLRSLKKIDDFVAVVHIGGCRFHRVNHSAVRIHADVLLVAEVPLVALFDGMSFRITLLFFVDACPSSSLIRLIVNCFFTSLLYLFPDILAVLSLCGIALSIGEQLVLETYKGMGSTFKIQC